MQEFAARPRPPAGVVTRSAPAVQRCGDHPCPPGGGNKEEEQRLSRSATGPAPGVAPPVVHEVIGSPGEPLPASLNEGMSARFGHDFARVRVHTGPRAAESAASVAARAYTVGQHVVLGRSAPDLHSAAGQRLLAHELTHVIQQPAAVPSGELPISSPADPGEREAAAAATRAVPLSAPPSVQREPLPNAAVLWRQVARDDQEEEERKARSPNAGTTAGAPAPAQPQDAGAPAQPQDAGAPAQPQDAGAPAQPQDGGTTTPPQGARPAAATAPVAVPPVAAKPPAAATGLATCPEPPSQPLMLHTCSAPVAAKPPPTEKAEFPVIETANFTGDPYLARFAADLARCWAEREVKQEIENRFKADVAAAKNKATSETAAATKAAVKAATEGIAPSDKAALEKARTQATRAAKAAAEKKIAVAQAAVTRQKPDAVVTELATAHLNWLKKDYADTIENSLKEWKKHWLALMQQALVGQRAGITKAKTAKPKVKKGQAPPPAKSPDEIDAEIEAEMTKVRCGQQGWAWAQILDIAHAWAVSKREQVDFVTVPQTVAELVGFAPSYQPADADLVPVPASVAEEGATPIAPELAAFLTELERVLATASPPQRFTAGNRSTHGLGVWKRKYFSVDLKLPGDHPRDRDSRGFYPHSKAIGFLLSLNEVAKSMKATWRVIYNDFSVAREVNAHTGSRNVIYVGGNDKENGLVWHGPAPLLLHFHLDLEIPQGAQAPAPPLPLPLPRPLLLPLPRLRRSPGAKEPRRREPVRVHHPLSQIAQVRTSLILGIRPARSPR